MHKMEYIGYIIGIVGIIIGILIALYQNKTPDIKVYCNPNDDGNPAIILCKVENNGRREAKDVIIGFNKMFPYGTKVFSTPEVGASMTEVDELPDPVVNPSSSELMRAFVINIPRIAPKDIVRFEIRTLDLDNQRAAAQVRKIHSEIEKILIDFGNKLHINYPEYRKTWDTATILKARIKEENFFIPDKFSYENGREEIVYYSDEEKLAKAHCKDLYARHKKEFIDVFNNRKEFVVPVVNIKTSEGQRTYASFPPYVKTVLNFAVPKKTISDGKPHFSYPPIPKSYD